MPQVLKNDIREKILKNALSEFIEKGYSNTSMKDIAASTGIAVGNIYRYFKNKEILYDAVAAPVHDKIIGLFLNPPGDGSLKGIEARINKFIEIYHGNKGVFMMLLKNSDSTRFEDMSKNIIINFSKAISSWKERVTGTANTEDDRIFMKAFSTAYLNGVISILSEAGDEEVTGRRLYDFLFFMKEGLFAKFCAKHPTDG